MVVFDISYKKTNEGMTILKSFVIGVIMEIIFVLWLLIIKMSKNNWVMLEILIPIFVTIISSFVINKKSFKIANIKNKNSIMKFVYQILGAILFFFVGYFLIDKFKLVPYLRLSDFGEYGERISNILSSESWILVLGFLIIPKKHINYTMV